MHRNNNLRSSYVELDIDSIQLRQQLLLLPMYCLINGCDFNMYQLHLRTNRSFQNRCNYKADGLGLCISHRNLQASAVSQGGIKKQCTLKNNVECWVNVKPIRWYLYFIYND